MWLILRYSPSLTTDTIKHAPTSIRRNKHVDQIKEVLELWFNSSNNWVQYFSVVNDKTHDSSLMDQSKLK